MGRVLEKVERRLGEKLFLKGEHCAGPKCAAVRRNYPPGVHGQKKKARRSRSEYSQLLREKQKVRFSYGLDDKDVERYSEEATKRPGLFVEEFIKMIESRLDNIVWRFGFAVSRRAARLLVNHGHITVNGKIVNIPSYRVKKDDAVAVKEASLRSVLFADLDVRLKKLETPRWLNLDKTKKIGTLIAGPETEDLRENIEFSKIKEYYAR